MFDLAESLGIIVAATLEDTKRILTEYFAPQRNVEYEVFTFAAQLVDETLDTFRARLRQLAKNCSIHEVEREVLSQS